MNNWYFFSPKLLFLDETLENVIDWVVGVYIFSNLFSIVKVLENETM